MSKIGETKKRILNSLKQKSKTLTDLSDELGLAPSTVGEHLQELQQMNAIREIDNSERKWRYYEITPGFSEEPQTFRRGFRIILSMVIIAVVAIAAIYFLLPKPSTAACTPAPGYSCQGVTVTSSKSLSLSVGGFNAPTHIAGIGCSYNSSTPTVFSPLDINVSTGAFASLNITCQSPPGTFNGTINIWLNYTRNGTEFVDKVAAITVFKSVASTSTPTTAQTSIPTTAPPTTSIVTTIVPTTTSATTTIQSSTTSIPANTPSNSFLMCNNAINLTIGASDMCGNFTVTLNSVTRLNASVSSASLSVYYANALTNVTTVITGRPTAITVRGHTLGMAINSTSQNSALLILSTNTGTTTVTTTTIPQTLGGCNVTKTVYINGSDTCGNFAIELTDITANRTRGTINVYNKGILTNVSTITTTGASTFAVGSNVLTVNTKAIGTNYASIVISVAQRSSSTTSTTTSTTTVPTTTISNNTGYVYTYGEYSSIVYVISGLNRVRAINLSGPIVAGLGSQYSPSNGYTYLVGLNSTAASAPSYILYTFHGGALTNETVISASGYLAKDIVGMAYDSYNNYLYLTNCGGGGTLTGTYNVTYVVSGASIISAINMSACPTGAISYNANYAYEGMWPPGSGSTEIEILSGTQLAGLMGVPGTTQALYSYGNYTYASFTYPTSQTYVIQGLSRVATLPIAPTQMSYNPAKGIVYAASASGLSLIKGPSLIGNSSSVGGAFSEGVAFGYSNQSGYTYLGVNSNAAPQSSTVYVFNGNSAPIKSLNFSGHIYAAQLFAPRTYPYTIVPIVGSSLPLLNGSVETGTLPINTTNTGIAFSSSNYAVYNPANGYAYLVPGTNPSLYVTSGTSLAAIVALPAYNSYIAVGLAYGS